MGVQILERINTLNALNGLNNLNNLNDLNTLNTLNKPNRPKMITTTIDKVNDALDAVQDAAYLAFRYNESDPWNETHRHRISSALDKAIQMIEQPFEKSWIFDKLRMEVAENLLQYPKDRPFVMKEIIWKLLAPFQKGLFEQEQTFDVTITSYEEKILDCTILGVWAYDTWKEGVKDDDAKDYLYIANNMALHIIEALTNIVEKGSFEARESHTEKPLFGDEQSPLNTIEARANPEKSQLSPNSAKTDEQATKNNKRIPKIENADALKKYFNMKFQNNGKFDDLISDISDLRSVKDCSTVAHMIFNMTNGAGFINSFSTFAAWCRVFFENIGVTVSENYNFSKHTPPTDELKRKFYYLV